MLNQKGFSTLFILLGIIIVIGIVSGAFYFGKLSGKQASSQPSYSDIKIPQNQQQIPQTPKNIQIDNAADWKTYQIKTINMEFKLPSNLNSAGEFKEEVISAPDPYKQVQTGSEICMRLTKKITSLIKTVYAGGIGCMPQDTDLVLIGGSSTDFKAPRSGSFVELQGYKIENSTYYAKNNLGKVTAIPSELVKEIINPYGVHILKIQGQTAKDGSGYGLFGNLADGMMGALINTNNTTYPGISIETKTSDISEATFDEILSTFKFTN